VLVERDPAKRRVKPVEPHLLQLNFAGIGSSSDDSDFKAVTDDESGLYTIRVVHLWLSSAMCPCGLLTIDISAQCLR